MKRHVRERFKAETNIDDHYLHFKKNAILLVVHRVTYCRLSVVRYAFLRRTCTATSRYSEHVADVWRRVVHGVNITCGGQWTHSITACAGLTLPNAFDGKALTTSTWVTVWATWVSTSRWVLYVFVLVRRNDRKMIERCAAHYWLSPQQYGFVLTILRLGVRLWNVWVNPDLKTLPKDRTSH